MPSAQVVQRCSKARLLVAEAEAVGEPEGTPKASEGYVDPTLKRNPQRLPKL